MTQVRLETGLVEWEPELLQVAFRDGRVAALTPVSFDDGVTWTTATAAVWRHSRTSRRRPRPFRSS